eukprot:1990938-Pyramimonas_sp.AAC.1
MIPIVSSTPVINPTTNHPHDIEICANPGVVEYCGFSPLHTAAACMAARWHWRGSPARYTVVAVDA